MKSFDGSNPFRPGAGQRPIYLAGRTKEQDNFRKLLDQAPVMRNVILTGLRGVGKTVLLENLKPLAQQKKWLWTGNDLSESASLTEERIAQRIVTDLSVLLGPIFVHSQEQLQLGFERENKEERVPLSFENLWGIYRNTPGLTDDKLKAVFREVRTLLTGTGMRGIVFAYDEAQNLADHASDKEYPLSLILDVFASLQREHTDVSFLLVLTGLPTLFPKLNEARTYTERMFEVMHLSRLTDEESRLAIEKPIEMTESPLRFSKNTINQIIQMSGGYPYFIQYICKEVFDAWIGRVTDGEAPSVPASEITRKLDQDFFSPRWERATERQQQFMQVIAQLETSDTEFTAQEIVLKSKQTLEKGFSPSHAVQMLQNLADKGLVYRNRHGKYSFAVPLLSEFIKRQYEENDGSDSSPNA